MTESMDQRQRGVCPTYGTDFFPPALGSTLGVSRNVAADLYPLNGLRHSPHADTCGWYLWRGVTLSRAEEFFQPMHVEHLSTECPQAMAFLALPPGWRFLLAPGQVEVWYDVALLAVE